MNQLEKFYNVVDKEVNKINGANRKDINFIELVSLKDGVGSFNYGYWITYLHCKPLYQKESINIEVGGIDLEGYDFCNSCGGAMKVSQKGNKYCSNICWK